MTEFDYYYENGFKQHFEYRKLFVKFEKASNSSLVLVLNDGYYLGEFASNANNQVDFELECKRWLDTHNK